jgi:hypothetical protein
MAVLIGIGLLASVGSKADENDAKKAVKAMADYMAQQTNFSFGYDATLEFVTKDHQKLMLTSSGTIDVSRPDKVRVTRDGGFSSVEMVFDGKTITLANKNANIYTQIDSPGSLDHLIDELRNKYHKPVPGADLLLTNAYDELMDGVTDVKDLGSGVIGGKECDHFAFRTAEVDWQIWIAHGNQPHPCRYVITSRQVDQAPQYSVQVRNWKTGGKAVDFHYKGNARRIEIGDLGDVDELPKQFVPGDAK